MVTRSSPPWIFLREPSFVWCFPNTRDASEGRKKLSTDRAMVDEIIRHVETSAVEFPRDDSLLWVNSPSPSAFMSPNSSVMTEGIFLKFYLRLFLDQIEWFSEIQQCLRLILLPSWYRCIPGNIFQALSQMSWAFCSTAMVHSCKPVLHFDLLLLSAILFHFSRFLHWSHLW